LIQYNRFVKPAYDDFIKPTMKYTDIIVPFTYDNKNAVQMLVQNLQIKLQVMRQQKRDALQGLRIRTFSDLIGSPSFTSACEQPPLIQPSMEAKLFQFNTFVEEKHKIKVASLVQQFVQLCESTESTLSPTDLFCLRQCIKEMARKLTKLIPHSLL